MPKETSTKKGEVPTKEEIVNSLRQMFDEILQDSYKKIIEENRRVLNKLINNDDLDDFLSSESERKLDEIDELLSNQQWAYYSVNEEGMKREYYIKLGMLEGSPNASLFGIKVCYERNGRRVDIEMVVDSSFFKYVKDKFGCTYVIGNKKSLADYLFLLNDLPDEILESIDPNDFLK